MSCFSPDTGRFAVAVQDPTKRVNYNLGMVLGVDDFRQEQAYHREGRHRLARELLGYGTVRGLAVMLELDGSAGWRVRVTAGTALSPSGILLCVPADQCCNLGEWLAAQGGERASRDLLNAHVAGSPDGHLRLYVTVSYRDCPTDDAPIPGEPCRSEEELMQPSRLKDDFCLELRYEPPPQQEEDAIRDFVLWLAQIPVNDEAANLDTAAWLEEIRAAASVWLSGSLPSPLPGDFLFGSPDLELRISREQLRAALELWATELRPLWFARYGCGAQPPLPRTEDDAVVLAVVDLPVLPDGDFWVISDSEAPSKDEAHRPVLLHLRLLQELSLYAGGGGEIPTAGNAVAAEQAFGLLPDAGLSVLFSRADHTHGTPALPTLAGDVTGELAANTVDSLQGVALMATGANEGEVLTFSGGIWRPASASTPEPAALAGDVQGPPGGNSVAALRGVALDATVPAEGQVLTFAAGAWRPATPTSPTGAFVERIGRGTYAIVAAGRFRISASAADGSRLQVEPLRNGVYNALKAGDSTATQFPYFIPFTFEGYAPEGDHVVKLTAGWVTGEGGTRQEFSVYF
ncbi:MAG: hypothetical protein FJ189_05205, partial [Gammaproteobacteria bacterium]|nr:hypothetical protein [Gammaproteobacteria bacterium]